jgi:CTP:molybdopterin cytidylyltransferase MocA
VSLRAVGLVAAAGRSGRMGRPKALLSTSLVDPLGPLEPWVNRLVRQLREGGVDEVVVTVPDDIEVAQAIGEAVGARAHTTRNERPELGLTGSVIAALERVSDADVLVICPVDAPGAPAAIVRQLVSAVAEGAAAAVVVHRGRRGHPAAFAASTFPLLRAAGERGGPRAVLEAASAVVVESDDPAVLWDLNTQADLDRLR